MRTRYLLSAVAVLSTLAFAATAAARATSQTDDLNWRGAAPTDRAPGARVLDNANECGADAAEPTWSRDGRLLGYLCVTPSANGA